MRHDPSAKVRMSRREFLAGGSGALLGLALTPTMGCRGPAEAAARAAGFPLLEVTGTPYETGLAIGERFGGQVRQGLARRRKWFDELREFMRQDLASRYEPFLAAGREQFPEIVEELRGWADGSGVAFEDLMALNLKAELAAMRDHGEATPGCSTLAFSHGGKRLLAHNEDGHRAYHDLMFLVRFSQPGKPSVLCLTYPGILCGNGPAINEAGMVVTTNFIGGREVRPGVPRYFVSRAVVAATGLDEAVEIATHPRRAFSFHFNLGSREEKRILSVETSPDRHRVHEVSGLYVHTNHLLLPGMEATPQDAEYVETSSVSRYRVLRKEADRLKDRLSEIDGETLVAMLSKHDGAPYSPCRHPARGVSGATLGTALFDIDAGTLRLLYSNPCLGVRAGTF